MRLVFSLRPALWQAQTRLPASGPFWTLPSRADHVAGMQHSALGQRRVDHRPLHAFPILGVALADDDNVKRHPERTERSTYTHHLSVPVRRVALYDQEAEVAVRSSVTASMRTKELLAICSADCRCRLPNIPANQVRATTSYRPKTGMAGRFSKSPWPLIRQLHEERFGRRGTDALPHAL